MVTFAASSSFDLFGGAFGLFGGGFRGWFGYASGAEGARAVG